MGVESGTEATVKQDRQALLEAKFCPRVAGVSCTQKRTKTYAILTFEYDVEVQ